MALPELASVVEYDKKHSDEQGNSTKFPVELDSVPRITELSSSTQIVELEGKKWCAA